MLKPKRLTLQKMRQPLDDDIALIFDKEDAADYSQPLIAIPQEKLTDFYAFVATYVQNYRPFSAFFKVVPYELLPELTSLSTQKKNIDFQMDCLIGVAIAEVYTQSRGRKKSIDTISVSAVQATLSATLVEAIWQGYRSEIITDLSHRWLLVRELEESGNLFLDVKKVSEVWEIVADVASGKVPSKNSETRRNISLALKQAIKEGTAIKDWIAPLAKEVPTLGTKFDAMSRNREERVRVVKDILPVLIDSSANTLTKEFLAGALVSMVGNGSFTHLSLLDDVLIDLPSAALWFAVVSSYQKGNDALTVGNCLGRRAVRDMNTSFYIHAPPSEDIAIEELEMYRSEKTDSPIFRTAQPASMTVNLLGSVRGRFRIGNSNQSENQRIELEAINRTKLEQIQELRMLLDKAQKVARTISAVKQRDMFDDR